LDAGHPSTIIIPLTTNLIEDAEPLRIRVKAREKLARDSDLLIDQIRAIDNRRITSGPIANLEPETDEEGLPGRFRSYRNESFRHGLSESPHTVRCVV